MSELIRFEIGDSDSETVLPIFLEVPDDDGPLPVSTFPLAPLESIGSEELRYLGRTISKMLNGIKDGLASASPDEVSIELGATVGSSAIVFSTKGTIKISAKWKKPPVARGG